MDVDTSRTWSAEGIHWTAVEYGDSALRVAPVVRDRETAWTCVHQLANAINGARAPGVLAATATFTSILVEFDPSMISHAEVATATEVRSRAPKPPDDGHHTAYVVPVVYGGEHGPDLTDVALELGVEPEAVVEAHLRQTHPVRCLSHSAAPMFDGLTFNSEVGRLPAPRTLVAAGSVMVAGQQSMILCADQPSGWRVIGRTPIRLVDPARAEPVLHRPGDMFGYRSIAPTDWEEHVKISLSECRVRP
jgi:KipI family sensor histidine kinase inhibitor